MNNYDADVYETLKETQMDRGQDYLDNVYDESQLSTIRFYQMTDYYGRPKFDYELSIGVINAFFPKFGKPNYTLKAKVVEYQLSQKPNNGGENSTLMSFSPSIKLLLDSQTNDGKSLSELRKLGLICCTINKEVEIVANKININDFYIISEIRMPDEILDIEMSADEKANQFVNITLVKLTDIRTDSGLSIVLGVKEKRDENISITYRLNRVVLNNLLVNDIKYQSNKPQSFFIRNNLQGRYVPICLIPVEINDKIKFVNLWQWNLLSGTKEMSQLTNKKNVDLSKYLNLGSNINYKGSTMILQPNELKSITFNDGVIETGQKNTQARAYNLTMPIIWNTEGAVSTWPTVISRGIGTILETTNYILQDFGGYDRSTFSGFRKFGRVDIVLNDTKKTTLFKLLLDLMSTTYNIRRGFKDATYTEQGNPSNGVAILKNDLGSQTPQAYITNKIKQWELENPTLINDDIYKINFYCIIAMLSKYIDCDYSINGGGNDINNWLTGMYAELISTPIKKSDDLYEYTTCYVDLKVIVCGSIILLIVGQ